MLSLKQSTTESNTQFSGWSDFNLNLRIRRPVVLSQFIYATHFPK